MASHSFNRTPRRLADDNFAFGASYSEFAANQRNPRLWWQHVDTRQFHHLRDGATVAMPMPPQAVQSMTMPRVAGRVVRKLEVILHNRSLAEL